MTQQIKSYQLDIDTELILNADPTQLLGAASKQYVDNTVGQVQLISSGNAGGIDYQILSNGMYVYNGVYTSFGVNNNVVINLPIANPNGLKAFFMVANGNISFVSLSTTQLIINDSAGNSSTFTLIAL